MKRIRHHADRCARLAGGDRAAGFTLLEVLVSVLVLSIGLLGIAKLVMFSARANDSAYLRSQATNYAYAILDAMRANRSTAMTAGYDTALGAAAANPGFSCVGATTCSPANLALYDVYVWKTRVAAALPSGQGSVTTVTAGPQTTATIVVQWDDQVAQSTFGATAFGAASPISVTLESVL